MKLWEKIKKHSISSSFLASCILILAAILLQAGYRAGHEPEKLTKKFQNEFFEKEYFIKHHLTELEEIFLKTPDSVYPAISPEFSELFKENGLAFFVYHADSLVYWSTTEIPGVDKLSPDSTDETCRLILAQNGWYTTCMKHLGNYSFSGWMLIKSQYPFENDFLKNKFQSGFPVSATVGLSSGKTGNDIFTAEGKFLFGLDFPGNSNFPDTILYLLLFLYLATFIFLNVTLYRT
jgi:two-component system nitrogen regulation sensor histidine kinase NtrY